MGCYKTYHMLAGLNNRHLFLTVLEAGKSRVKMLASLVLGKGSLLGLQMAALLLYPHMVEKRNSDVYSSSYKGTSPTVGAPQL